MRRRINIAYRNQLRFDICCTFVFPVEDLFDFLSFLDCLCIILLELVFKLDILLTLLNFVLIVKQFLMLEQPLLLVSEEHVWLGVRGTWSVCVLVIKDFWLGSHHSLSVIITASIPRILPLRLDLLLIWTDTLEFLWREGLSYLFKSSDSRIFAVLVNRITQVRSLCLELVLRFDVTIGLVHELVGVHRSRLLEILQSTHIVSIQMLFLRNHFFVIVGNIFECIDVAVNYVSFDILGDVLSEIGGFDLLFVVIELCWNPSDAKLFRIHHSRTLRWSIDRE